MKKAFTMLELVFILVILGILAAIAIPKISASREDAKIVAYKNDISALKSSLPAFFLAQGKGNFKSAITLSHSNWKVQDFAISSTLENKNKQACVEVKLLSNENGTLATRDEDVKFLQLTANDTPKADGDTCEKLISQSGLERTQIIPLLSSSIVF